MNNIQKYNKVFIESFSINKEKLDKLQEIIEKQLDAMKLAHFDNEEVRKTIGKIIINQFKRYLKIY